MPITPAAMITLTRARQSWLLGSRWPWADIPTRNVTMVLRLTSNRTCASEYWAKMRSIVTRGFSQTESHGELWRSALLVGMPLSPAAVPDPSHGQRDDTIE